MIAKLGASVRYLLGNDVPGRNLRVYPDDTFIVSYPKSGNTWTRFLVASLIHCEEPMTFLKADQVIPTIDSQSRRFFRTLPRPRVIKSHFPFDQNYKRVIYIVRDPKDVAVSQYHYQIKRKVLQDGHPMEEFVPRFVAGETCPYGSWGENVGSWLAARRDNPGFLLLRYEDMIRHTDVELIKIANFLGIDPTPQRIQWAIEQSTADRMRKLEQKEAGQWDSTKDTRKDKFFVRSAKAGEGKAMLPEKCIAQIESAWGPLMRWLGYETASQTGGALSGRGFLESILEPSSLETSQR
jgi:hypothetical protein